MATRKATVADIHELATAMPDVTCDAWLAKASEGLARAWRRGAPSGRAPIRR